MDQESTTRNAQLPLLLRNMKKAFGKNIQGPIQYREREFSATAKPVFLFDIVKFLANRGVGKLAAINAWESEKDIKISYHFIAKVGTEFLDSKITIITYMSLDKRTIKSVKKIFPNARIFEDEINVRYQVEFKEKK